jgi:hypothetical protein
MKRIVLLTSLAAMMAAAMALSGVAQAKPITTTKADKACLAEAAKTLKASFNPDATFHGGTEGNDLDDTFKPPTEGPAVFCGFGGDDQKARLNVGDIFLGGEGIDSVIFNDGTFNGGEGIDSVVFNQVTGTFNGGPGDDSVSFNYGTFNGGEGIDSVVFNEVTGTFNGEAGNDSVTINEGTFNGGEGIDSVTTNLGGTISSVEQGDV